MRRSGPLFPSMISPPVRRVGSQRRYVFNANTQSIRQQKRNLRHKARAIIDSTDPVVVAVGDRVIRAVCHEPDPEFSALHLFCAALDASNDTGEPWAICMQYLMDTFEGKRVAEENHSDVIVVEKSEGNQIGARLRRLLRGFIPRSLRACDAAAAETNVDQSARARDAESASCNTDR